MMCRECQLSWIQIIAAPSKSLWQADHIEKVKEIDMTGSSSSPTVVLVHGAFADASGYAGVIRELQSTGLTVSAPPVPLRGLAFDAESVGKHVAAIDGPVLLVGHSYGGAVTTQAAASLDNVIGRVYLASWALDVGESLASVGESFAPVLAAKNGLPTSYDAVGAAGGPDLYIDLETFRETFCADVPVDVAAVMAVSQRPLSAAAFTEPCTSAGWKTKPTSFLVSGQDQAINPDIERMMAERMGARTETIDASHVAFISRPVETAAFILAALD
jgi:pimeloyl-ACP methyl ester carboxylesterase